MYLISLESAVSSAVKCNNANCNESIYHCPAIAQIDDTTSLQLIIEQLRVELNRTHEQLEGKIDQLTTANGTWQIANQELEYRLQHQTETFRAALYERKKRIEISYKPHKIGLVVGRSFGKINLG